MNEKTDWSAVQAKQDERKRPTPIFETDHYELIVAAIPEGETAKPLALMLRFVVRSKEYGVLHSFHRNFLHSVEELVRAEQERRQAFDLIEDEITQEETAAIIEGEFETVEEPAQT